MVFEFVENSFVAVAITSFLILFAFTNNNFDKRTNNLFLAAAFCILILIVEEAWEAQLALAASPAALRTALSALGYSLRPMIPYFLIITQKKYSSARLALLSAPLLCNALVSFSALFCNLAFWYTPDNVFVRGPLGGAPFLAAAFYAALLLVQTAREFRKGSFKEALIVSAIVLLALLSTAMESLLGFRFIQNPCMATSVTFFYLFLNSNQNNRDPLTGALTRRRFYLDADKYRGALAAVISLDLNDLKSLNDHYGHTEGDKALVTLARTIKKHMGSRASLYRVGGDEFMILCYKLDERAVRSLIGRIRGDLEQTDYRCAIGYAMYSYPFAFDRACQTADRDMYEDKRRMKGEMPSRQSPAPAVGEGGPPAGRPGQN
ncbi:GGDEF domain-containing protein [Bittarella massiliensis (ex Durand et al. 2017)]|uniref:GGDEF domain-containing protein n=1 Tax=Bittarella massiliensis (ex Durand et al. 2017) TaxID=1720313 RepID=UPI001AA188F7|nr:GGDEF domain-containing protein [Bittarella massiliensis (ex Durand et al. 2017)]